MAIRATAGTPDQPTLDARPRTPAAKTTYSQPSRGAFQQPASLLGDDPCGGKAGGVSGAISDAVKFSVWLFLRTGAVSARNSGHKPGVPDSSGNQAEVRFVVCSRDTLSKGNVDHA